MTKKGIAVHAIFLIGVIALFLIFTIAGLWIFLQNSEIEANKATCAEKLINYCIRWKTSGKDPNDWDKVNPEGCEKFSIEKPSSIDDCKNII